MFAALKSGGVIPALSTKTPPTPPPAAEERPPVAPAGNGSRGDNNSLDEYTVSVLAIPEGTEDFELKEHFQSCGEVTKINILPVRDGKVTTLGYVTFSTQEGVRSAIKKNDIEFNGSPLRILAGDMSAPGCQVKVYNIPEDTGEETIKSYFNTAGEVLRVRILPCREGKTVTLGFVTYATEAGCRRAVAEMNGYEIDGSKLNVVYENDQNGASASNGSSSFGNGARGAGASGSSQPSVKVYNIPEATGEETIKSLFGAHGEVRAVRILACREGKTVTLGFVTYATEAGCRRAAAEMNGYEIDGSKLNVVYENDQNGAGPSNGASGFGSLVSGAGSSPASLPSSAGSSRPGGPQAKVFGIPEGTDPEELKQYFTPAGEVKHVKILNILPNRDTCAGFIYFNTPEEVEKAVSLFNKTEFNGSTLNVMVGGQVHVSSGGGKFAQLTASKEVSGPTSRLPRMDTSAPPPPMSVPSNANGGGTIMLPDSEESGMACRRCGEMGHWARECVNAPVALTAQAVTYVPPDPPDTADELFAQGINEGINFDKYDCIPVELGGNNAPRPISSFQDAKLHDVCLENITRAKYKKPTPVQKYAIPGILDKRDYMACAQTGSGKTVAFLLPMITNMLNEDVINGGREFEGCASPLACIMSPTRELAIQIFIEARKFSYGTRIKPVVVYGGVSVNHQIERLQMGCHICVATPGRLDDFVKRGRISFRKLQYLVLDEADKMLDMGFGPQIGEIIHNSEMPPRGSRTTLMFSATFPDDIQKMAADFLNDYLFLAVGRVGAWDEVKELKALFNEQLKTNQKQLKDISDKNFQLNSATNDQLGSVGSDQQKPVFSCQLSPQRSSQLKLPSENQLNPIVTDEVKLPSNCQQNPPTSTQRNSPPSYQVNPLLRSQLNQPLRSTTLSEADVVFFHDSMGKRIHEAMLSPEVITTRKVLTYTFNELRQKIETELDSQRPPRVIVLHVGTNELKNHVPVESVTAQMDAIISGLKTTFPDAKVVLSDIVERDNKQLELRCVNSRNSRTYAGDSRVIVSIHDNIGYEDRCSDGVHLVDQGTWKLTLNLKHSIEEALGINIFPRTCADVTQVIIEVTGREKRNKLMEILTKSGTDRTLVFVEKKQDADFLACWLSQNNYPTTSMNADRSQQERENALMDFRKGVAPVLVATAVAARGLDIKDVKHVINFDLPSDTTEYVHRIGRTGRIGNKGLATSFFDPMRDDRLARGLVKLLSEGEQDVPDWLESTALNAVGTGYGENRVVSDQRSKPTMGSYGGGSRGGGGGGGGDDEEDEEEW